MQEPSGGVPTAPAPWKSGPGLRASQEASSKQPSALKLERSDCLRRSSLLLSHPYTRARKPVVSKHKLSRRKRCAMCKHTQRPGARAICGTPISYYQDNLKNRRRFRFRLCPATEREVIDAVIQRGKLEPPSRRWILQLAASCGIRFSAEDKPRGGVRAGAEPTTKVHVPYIDRVLEDKFANKVETILKLAVKKGSITTPPAVYPSGPATAVEQPQPSTIAATSVTVSIEASTNADAMTMDRSSDSQEGFVEQVEETGLKVREKRKQKKKVARRGRHDAIDALVDDIWKKMCL
ncbi:hypothetical protein CCHR01_16848 [Colletotrichum chrysophilum]|uniref:Uncharacterized protein n=1 Tax=Colletotrichum chrysophilum TaxID=1836956 RepID=A0AAD9A3Q8_9PEZI|nr:hypothetical protein CCHR01_16848 [Colletotrichum chrysophilum]